MVLKPRTLLTFDGFPQFQASWTANATIDWSSRTLPSSVCGRPMPHALSGCDLSLQFSVLLVQFVVLKPAMPIPERMFQVASLNVPVVCPVSTLGELAPAGCVGAPPQARIRIVHATAVATLILLRRVRKRLIRRVYEWPCLLSSEAAPQAQHYVDRGASRAAAFRRRPPRRDAAASRCSPGDRVWPASRAIAAESSRRRSKRRQVVRRPRRWCRHPRRD